MTYYREMNKMPEFKIEKGVPLPPKGTGRKNGTYKYPFRDMEVGDSFFVPITDRKQWFSTAAMKALPGWKFAQRKVTGGIRVWRVE